MRGQDKGSTWPTQTKTQPCAQAQNEQRHIKQRQDRQGCQGRILTAAAILTLDMQTHLV